MTKFETLLNKDCLFINLNLEHLKELKLNLHLIGIKTRLNFQFNYIMKMNEDMRYRYIIETEDGYLHSYKDLPKHVINKDAILLITSNLDETKTIKFEFQFTNPEENFEFIFHFKGDENVRFEDIHKNQIYTKDVKIKRCIPY